MQPHHYILYKVEYGLEVAEKASWDLAKEGKYSGCKVGDQPAMLSIMAFSHRSTFYLFICQC